MSHSGSRQESFYHTRGMDLFTAPPLSVAFLNSKRLGISAQPLLARCDPHW